jgi:hypothetical protein
MKSLIEGSHMRNVCLRALSSGSTVLYIQVSPTSRPRVPYLEAQVGELR